MVRRYIGVDVASRKLNLYVTHPREGGEDYEILNNQESVGKFIKQNGLKPKDYVVGAESTGRYHLICQKEFVNKGFEFRLINPILTGNKIAHSIRKKKTDKSDAKLIATLISQKEGKVIKADDLDLDRRSILRTRSALVSHRTAIKVMLKDLTKSSESQKIKKTMTVLKRTTGKLDKSIKDLESMILDKEEVTKTEKLIRTIPGFAERLSAVVAEEIKDFSRFPSSTQLKAYVGIDPKVTQSGNSLKTGKITKRGNPHLRSAFYLAAQVARQHDPQLKAFYQKKISEGKPVRVAIVAVARKLVERVYAVVKNNRPYEVRPA
ncbi:IS110 family transposase [Patescibacteria group bacterium]|nr:IS110 family transposase [Patescibacteria group bacterium]